MNMTEIKMCSVFSKNRILHLAKFNFDLKFSFDSFDVLHTVAVECNNKSKSPKKHKKMKKKVVINQKFIWNEILNFIQVFPLKNQIACII